MAVEFGASLESKLHVAFRCDASLKIGSGHVMRCLALANALRERGARCTFITCSEPGNINTRIEGEGHSVEVLALKSKEELSVAREAAKYVRGLALPLKSELEHSRVVIERIDPDIVIVDHYGLDHVWHERVCANRPVVVIDDLADRRHDCAILLDQNFGRNADDYIGLVPADAQKLVGPSYALLRPEFKEARRTHLVRRRSICRPLRVLISMGGADSDDSTGRILETLSRIGLSDQILVTVVMGGAAPFLSAVREIARNLPFRTKVVSDVENMAALMQDIDLAIGAAGGSVWERCCLGIPSLLLNIADNQQPAAHALDEAGVAVALGDFAAVGWQDRLLEALGRYSKPEELLKLSEAATGLVDGYGASRVASEIIARFLMVREATESDARDIWEWRHAGGAECFYRSGGSIPYDEHMAWLEAALRAPGRYLLIVEIGGVSAAHIRFDPDDNEVGVGTVSISISPDFRGKKLAQSILLAGMNFAVDKGFTKLNATVHSENLASHRLFLSCGFCRVGSDGKFIFLSKRVGQTGTNTQRS